MGIKKINIGKNLLAENDKIAEENFLLLKEKRILSFNLMGSPGAGKTKILERTIPYIKKKFGCGVIEGDIAGTFDSKRLEKFKIPIVQINTGGVCHLDAFMIKKGIEKLPLDEIKILFVENVGNLVCPAEFKIGIEKNIVVSSITEGEDKSVKYPLIFKISDVCLINKTDLLKFLKTDIKKIERNILTINKNLKIIKISAETGENVSAWINYIFSEYRKYNLG